MDALSELVRDGKVRYLGFSEWPRAGIEATHALFGVQPFVASQPQYSLRWRGPEPWLIPLCARSGISQLAWAPLAQGILADFYEPGQPPTVDTRAVGVERNALLERFLHDELLERVQRLQPLATQLALTMAQLALAWVLREPSVASAIAASGVELEDQTLRQTDETFGDVVFHETPDG
jgi:aryl-alcohol dehydrogenase-like predicted oxidoreductase